MVEAEAGGFLFSSPPKKKIPKRHTIDMIARAACVILPLRDKDRKHPGILRGGKTDPDPPSSSMMPRCARAGVFFLPATPKKTPPM